MDIKRLRNAIGITREPECIQGKGVTWTISIPAYLIPEGEDVEIRVVHSDPFPGAPDPMILEDNLAAIQG